MFFFRRKSTISSQELADTLAPRFTKTTVELFEQEKEARGEQSWTVESAKGKCRTDPLKEWVLFSLAGYINGCRSSMKQDATHFEFVRSFIAVCGRDFVARGVFTSEAEFEQLAMERMSDYMDALQDGDAEKKMQLVGRKFLVNVGCELDDISGRVGAIGSFMNESIHTKKLFDDLQKSYRVVSHSGEKK